MNSPPLSRLTRTQVFPLTEGRVTIWWAWADEGLPEFSRLLSPQENKRLAQYRNDVLKAEFLTGAVLLRSALGRHTGLSPTEVRIARECPDCDAHHGRPRSLDAPELDVSVSHAGGRVAVAVAHGMRVGVDVESLSRVGDANSLVDAICSPLEAAHVRKHDVDRQPQVLTDIWTQKEAVLKALGTGLRIPARHLEVAIPGSAPKLHTNPDTGVRLPTGLTVRPLTACGPGYTAALATSTSPVEVRELAGEALLSG
ncbi:4'-phosphopantetheinyl transferase family protein [Streptomyces melanogenes]|uniref:4'-phosphopantetheinyl transferase family protein n=1 Tax=Streptomyces melanogenes TaxID=67326 RepID=UPI00167E6AA4|nr:4'-phosphopantetheinyl transferase superfamily protein [Streptomyces melanogenes]GGP83944.1 4'-phosphopantetheinyl transferase [Streptomyces melanogenes]